MLLIHSNHFEFEVKSQAIKAAEPLVEELKKDSIDDALIVFCTIENSDEQNRDSLILQVADEISKTASNVGTTNILVYPYAHLSDDLGPPSLAIPLLIKLTENLASRGLNVKRSPFGYYKSFKLECKGHPMAELSKNISVEKSKSKPKPIETKFMVFSPDGKLSDPEEYLNYQDHEFKSLIEKEVFKKALHGGEPKYLEYCKKFGIEWEPYSDVGHMRFGPQGTLLFELISEHAWLQAKSTGIPLFRVRGTNMFDLSVEPVKQHADLFGDRLYEVDLDQKRFVMRYAACHQQFAMVKDWSLSYKQFPFGTFELADSYRLEQSGELLLCFRVRKLHMPDLHVYCRDTDEAKTVSHKIHEKIYDEIRALGREYVSIYNTTQKFFENNKDYFMELVRIERKPILINFVPEGVFYWVLNVEYTIIDELDRPREIATFQIDVGNAERFNISYTDHYGGKKYPVIIHTAIIGTVERYMFTIFDCATKAEKLGKKPQLPLWLSPTQIRIIPVTPEQLTDANSVADKLEKMVRVDIDDREETLQKRIRDAEVNWVPYIMVIGKKESGAKKFPVRIRNEKNTIDFTINDLLTELSKKNEGYPFLPMTLPRLISTRPGYR
ncbi:threonine--tRNA ligase [[Eubacterium] cellulosolvens]